ncbi:MAG: CRTAC1 family protein [Isosphaeraceae bacterium]
MRSKSGLGSVLVLIVMVPGVWTARADDRPGVIRFQDVAKESGVGFRFDNGTRGKHDLPEIMGGGVALIDVDGDGRLDLYFCNGGPIVAEAGRNDPPCRLYRNEGPWRFTDITDSAGCPGPSYAMGAAVGDFDGDGRDDLFVTGWRDQRLYRNLGGGRFVDVTDQAGLGSDLWSTSSGFADFDRDGDLDLYVAAYLDYDSRRPPFCAAPDGLRDFCGPEDFPAQADRLYRNNGDGTFTDVSAEAGIALPDGRALGVLIADLTGNSLLDVYVANDGTPCRLFENQGGLRFRDVGLEAGVALDDQGNPLAGMGVALGDLDGDGRSELLVSNFFGRSTIAFRAEAHGLFRDASTRFGLTVATHSVLGFGLGLADFDADGRLDLLQANGHVLDRARLGTPFAMRPLILRNDGTRLTDVSTTAGHWFARPILGRGVAVGDLDGDGRPDAVVNALDAPAAVLRNISKPGNTITIELVGKAPSPRSAIGARVVATVAGRTLVRDIVGGDGYLSASTRLIHFGLDEARRIDRLDVTWPSGRVETWTDFHAGPTIRLEEGTASP